MSDERRKRQQARIAEEQPGPGTSMKPIVIAAIVVVVVGGLYAAWYKHSTRLDAFAQCLSAKQAKMYGAYWCPHCAEQKDMFGRSFRYAPYIECGIKGSRGIAAVCTEAQIQRFPTWIFADGTRTEGEKSLEYLSDKTGCSLP
jgi:hypothetical protein